MDIAQRHAARRNYRHYVDISKFTGMEVEHRHDTAGEIPGQNELHASAEDQQRFRKKIDRAYQDLQSKAFQH
jgi:hypothetical protein